MATAKRKTPLKVEAKSWVVGLVVGLLVGAGTMFAFLNYNPPDARAEEAQAVFGRIVKQNEMVSVSQDYAMVERAGDSARLLNVVDIPFTDNSFWYYYVGTIKAGVSLEDASIEVSGTVITVTLSQPYIISNTPDMEQTGVLEERNNIFNPIHVEDVDALQQECVKKSEEQALAGGLMEEARASTETNLTNIFIAALGEEYTVEFVWREE